jgi:hypothetical protein
MAGVVTKIATGTASGVYDLEFTGISGSYDDLMIIGSVKGSHTGDAAFDKTIMNMRFNGDTGANYFWLFNKAVDSGTRGADAGNNTTLMQTNLVPTSYSSNTGWGQFKIYIPGYSDASGNAAKRAYYLGGYGQGTHGSAMTQGNCGWSSTAAITEVGFYMAWYNFVAGTTMTLYGITNA